MQTFVIIIIGLMLLILISIPAWLIWFVAANFLPKKLALPPARMTILCVVLSLATAVGLNIELAGGVATALIMMLTLSCVWSALLLPLCILVRILINRQSHPGNT